MQRLFSLVVALALSTICLAEGTNSIAVYVGPGAHGLGHLEWIRQAGAYEGFNLLPVDGKSIRAGALDSAAALIIPGGYSNLERKQIGPEGAEKIRAFVRAGGGYVGTCAGCILACQGSKDRPNMLGLAPFRPMPTVSRGRAEMLISFNSNAFRRVGIAAKPRKIVYSYGPQLEKGEPVPDANFDLIANYASEIRLLRNDAASYPMCGTIAGFAGTYGKGRVIALAVHPEMESGTHDLAKKMLEYALGRPLKLKPRLRHRRGNLQLAVIGDYAAGIGTAKFLDSLSTLQRTDFVMSGKSAIDDGLIYKLDVLVLPDAVDQMDKNYWGATRRELLKEFLAHGGNVITWGEAAKELAKGGLTPSITGFHAVADGASALAKIRELEVAPARMPPVAKPAKIEKPWRCAVYLGTGGGSTGEARLLDSCPEFEVFFTDGPGIAAGDLDRADILVQGGGGGQCQCDALGAKGQTNLIEFVRRGGLYHGTCAGSFLVLEPTRRRRVHMVPMQPDDPPTYRGGAFTQLKITEAGAKWFDRKAGALEGCYYHGGSVMIPGTKPVPGASDFQVLAEYYGHIVCTDCPGPTLPMSGKGAIVGGSFGKGKMVVCGPHPESDRCSDNLYFGKFHFLTGVKPHPVHRWNVKGLPRLVMVTGYGNPAAGRLHQRLAWDTRFNFGGTLADILVLVNPKPGQIESYVGFGKRLVVYDAHGDHPVKNPERYGKITIVRTEQAVMDAISSRLN